MSPVNYFLREIFLKWRPCLGFGQRLAYGNSGAGQNLYLGEAGFFPEVHETRKAKMHEIQIELSLFTNNNDLKLKKKKKNEVILCYY